MRGMGNLVKNESSSAQAQTKESPHETTEAQNYSLRRITRSYCIWIVSTFPFLEGTKLNS